MRFSVASGTDNSLLQTISNSNDDIELHTHETDNHTRPYGVEGLSSIQREYIGNGIATHGETQRATYTVPANKITRLDYFSLRLSRSTPGSTSGDSYILIDITLSGGSSIRLSTCNVLSNTFGAHAFESGSPKIILVTGDQIEIMSAMGGSGGSFELWAALFLSEVDA